MRTCIYQHKHKHKADKHRLSPSRREAPCKGSNSAGRFITPGYFDSAQRSPKLSKLEVGRTEFMVVMPMRDI